MHINSYNHQFKKSHWKYLLQGRKRKDLAGNSDEVGHKLFIHRKSERVAIADYSAVLPHETDDGVLWIDQTKPIVIGNGQDDVKIPLLEPDNDGGERECHTFSDFKTAIKLQEYLDMTILYDKYEISFKKVK